MPEPHLGLIAERVALDQSDRGLIDPVAFGAWIARLSRRHLHQIEAIELIFFGQSTKSDRKEPQQLRAVFTDTGAADGLLVGLTRLRKGFDEDANSQCAIFAGNH